MKLFPFYIDENQLAAIKKLARKSNVSIAEIIRRAIARFLGPEEKK